MHEICLYLIHSYLHTLEIRIRPFGLSGMFSHGWSLLTPLERADFGQCQSQQIHFVAKNKT